MSIQIFPVIVKKEIQKGDDLVKLFLSNFKDLQDGDIIVISQKVISKQEGRIVELAGVIPSLLAVGIGSEYKKDPKLVEVILSESQRIVRMENGILITQTKHGFVCANAGVDESNMPHGFVSLLPENPDKSAYEFMQTVQDKAKKKVAVLISDTFGRPFREGQTNCAVGIAGINAIDNYEGRKDSFGRTLRVTAIAQADEICGAAELVMKKTKDCPFAVIRGLEFEPSNGSVGSLIRRKETDLFR
ncbi:MAG: coenzyme F420-0:L-glutamate ligase [Thermoproteota archaeon]|nr:coenzyme F420-0:L-glutamate ligase [Candidatus Nitrosotenuis sp.]